MSENFCKGRYSNESVLWLCRAEKIVSKTSLLIEESWSGIKVMFDFRKDESTVILFGNPAVIFSNVLRKFSSSGVFSYCFKSCQKARWKKARPR